MFLRRMIPAVLVLVWLLVPARTLAAAPPQPTILFFGDSISDPTFVVDGVPQGRYRDYISQEYDVQDVARGESPLHDFDRSAIVNTTVEDCGDDASFPAIGTWYYRVNEHHPDIVVFELGLNDWRLSRTNPCYNPVTMHDDLLAIIGALRNNGVKGFIVLSLPVRANAEGILPWNNALFDVAASMGCAWIEVSNLTSGDFTRDALHLTEQGHIHLFQDFVTSYGIIPWDKPLLLPVPFPIVCRGCTF